MLLYVFDFQFLQVLYKHLAVDESIFIMKILFTLNVN